MASRLGEIKAGFPVAEGFDDLLSDSGITLRDSTSEDIPQQDAPTMVERLEDIVEHVWFAHSIANECDDVPMAARMGMIATKLDKCIADLALEKTS